MSDAEAKAIWSSFPSIEGTRLRSQRLGLREWQLVSDEGAVWLTQRLPNFYGATKLRVDSTDYELKWTKRRARPVQERELVNSTTGQIIFKLVGVHFNGNAAARLSSPDQGWIEFPVLGRSRSNATLSAVDTERRVLVSCRLDAPFFLNHWRSHLEVVVSSNSPVGPSSALIASIASDLLLGFLARPGGGS